MDDRNRKSEIIKAMTDIEYHLTPLEKSEVSLDAFSRFPLSKISAMGVTFEPLTAVFQNVFLGGGGSGLYMVNTKGGTLVSAAQRSGYIGALAKGSNQVGAGMAELKPLVCNPTMLFMAAALMSIDKKLDSIQETQKEILAFLEQREKSRLRGNLIFLTDILHNYKHNWTNETYKNNSHIKVLDIKQEAEQSILFYREQISKKAKRKSLFHMDKEVNDMLAGIQAEFKEYQLALYLYAFSAFLEVMLLENFEAAFLDGVVSKIEDYSFRYRELYTDCYNRLEAASKSSVQAQLLSGLASISKATGDTIAKIPIVGKSQIDETLIEAGGRLGEFSTKRTERALGQLVEEHVVAAQLFIENIKMVSSLYNQPVELLFDEENLYFKLVG